MFSLIHSSVCIKCDNTHDANVNTPVFAVYVVHGKMRAFSKPRLGLRLRLDISSVAHFEAACFEHQIKPRFGKGPDIVFSSSDIMQSVGRHHGPAELT